MAIVCSYFKNACSDSVCLHCPGSFLWQLGTAYIWEESKIEKKTPPNCPVGEALPNFFGVNCCGTIQVIMNGVTNSYVALKCVRKQTEQTWRVRTNQHSLIALPLCSSALLPESIRWNKKLFVQLLLVMESFHSSRYSMVLCHIVDALFLY